MRAFLLRLILPSFKISYLKPTIAMPVNRFFIDIFSFKKGDKISLKDTEFHHLQVMRKVVDDQIEIFNGQGFLATAKILSFEKRSSTLEIEKISQSKPSTQKLILVQAITRSNKLDFIIEKGTELGTSEFWFFPSRLSEKKNINTSQKNRLETISISAAKQSGRLFLPKIKFFKSLKEIPKTLGNFYFGDIREKAPLLSKTFTPSKEIFLFIGPEKGFSNEEILYLEKIGVKGVNINTNILRSETAAISGISLISHLLDSVSEPA